MKPDPAIEEAGTFNSEEQLLPEGGNPCFEPRIRSRRSFCSR